jgi:cephalosporin hydroxylase
MRRVLLIVVLPLALAALPGCRKHKPPAAAVADERGAKLTSASELDIGDEAYAPFLLRGFYASEGDWRWTARKFAVSLTPPAGNEPVYLELDFALPAKRAVPAIVITARVNGVEVGRTRFSKTGRNTFGAPVPAAALRKSPAEVEFELDRGFRPPDDDRELGVVAVSAKFTHSFNAAFDRDAETSRARQGFEYLLAKRDLVVPRDRQIEMMKLFHQVPIWRHMFFQNVQIEKSPLDLWMMQQIAYETQPDFVIETGTWAGGSALYWAHTLNGMGLENSRVLTVDIQDGHPIAAAHPLWKKYVTFFHGSSTDPDVVSKIAQAVRGKKTLVDLDSDHSMAHVLKELNAYAPLVSRGGYLVVEDTHMDGVPTDPDFGPGPMAAVRKFLESGAGRNFEQDLTREAYIMTFNPGGWLKRRSTP